MAAVSMRSAIRAEDAAQLVPDGASVMIGGFLGVGTPERLLDALVARNARNLTVIANDTARPGLGIGRLIDAGCVTRVIVSHIGTNPVDAAQDAGRLDRRWTSCRRARWPSASAPVASGLGGILTPTGVGTIVAEGKQVITIEGRDYLLELPLRADFALVHAHEADHLFNLTYRLTATNFNPVMAMAADCVIAEAEEVVPVGVIPPDAVRTSGILVDHLVERRR